MKTETLARLTRPIAVVKVGYLASRALVHWHLRRRRAPVECEVMGFRMLLDPQEFLDQQLLFHPQTYEAAELEYVRGHLRPGDTFVDLGSHIGLYSLLASAAVGPSGRVVAVEADPDTFARLLQNLRLNAAANVQAYNCGVLDERGSLPLYRWIRTGPNAAAIPNAGAKTLFPPNRPGDEWAIEAEVSCLTLLNVLTLAGVSHITGLKLDIERAEYKVLRRFLAEAPRSLLPAFILCEEYEDPWAIELAGGSVAKLLESDGTYRPVLHPNTMKCSHIFEIGVP